MQFFKRLRAAFERAKVRKAIPAWRAAVGRLSPSYTKKGPGRRPRFGPGGGAKLRKRVTRGEGALRNPFCHKDHSLDPCWKLSRAARQERERQNAPL